MRSPLAAGVTPRPMSTFMRLAPARVQSLLQATAIDIGLSGYDECFAHGQIDALRAVTGDTSAISDPSAPNCPEYAE